MKRFLLLMMLAVTCLTVWADQYEPNTKWPYIYEDFQEGTIYMEGGKTSRYRVNVHLYGNVLHYINSDGRICRVADQTVTRVEIGHDSYVPVDGHLMRICETAKTADGQPILLLCQVEADFDALNQSTGAYGASTQSQAVTELTSLQLGGLNQPLLGELLEGRTEGSTLRTAPEYYFYVGSRSVDTSRKAVEALLDDAAKAELKTFAKQQKVKWNKEDSLTEVLHFLAEHYKG